MDWQTIDTIPDDDLPKLIAHANGAVCIAPGVAESLSRQKLQALKEAGYIKDAEPDPQWRATFWMYLPKAPMQ